MRWFRFYAEAVNDPKVQRLPADLFKTWVNLLCLAAQNDGVLPSIPDIAFTLRLSEEEADRNVSCLFRATLLDETDGCFTPHNWDARQYRSDTSTERVRRHRSKLRHSNERETGETFHVTPCNVSETPPDTESDTDTEQTQSRTDSEQSRDSIVRSKREPVRNPTEPEGFDEWYTTYPRHQGRGQAIRAYKQALKTTTEEVLLDGAKRYAEERAGQDKQYTRLPATWLNGQGWLDEPPPPPKVNGKMGAYMEFVAEMEAKERG